MLTSLNKLKGLEIQATDGEIGRVRDFYFDDRSWAVRYIVADTGNWLPGQLVLLSPQSLESFDIHEGVARFDLTRAQIEQSPSIETDAPVSRQQESQLAQYYGWPMYWATPMAYPALGYAPVAANETPESHLQNDIAADAEKNPTLRSFDEVTRYSIQTMDDEFGHMEDLLAEPDNWDIHYMVIDTRKWLPGRKILASVHWIRKIDWADRDIVVSVTRDQVKTSPELEDIETLDRETEVELHEHYGLPAYWQRTSAQKQ